MVCNCKLSKSALELSHLENFILVFSFFQEKPRVGVLSTGGNSLGFVFSDYNAILRQFREAVIDQVQKHATKRKVSLTEG